MSIRNVKPFASHNCHTQFHNALLDAVMPVVSANAWKLLCFIVRQTDGWNREEMGLSYDDLRAGTGIRSKATVSEGLKELLGLGLLGRARRDEQSEMRYSLNLDAEIPWMPKNSAVRRKDASSKIELLPSSKNEPQAVQKLNYPPSSKNEPHIRKEEKINSIKKKGEEKGGVKLEYAQNRPAARTPQQAPPFEDFSENSDILEPLKREIGKACGIRKSPDFRTDDQLSTQAHILKAQGVTPEAIREIVKANPTKIFKIKFFAEDILALHAATRRQDEPEPEPQEEAYKMCRALNCVNGIQRTYENGEPIDRRCPECKGKGKVTLRVRQRQDAESARRPVVDQFLSF